ncbi:MAG: hypothetical protein JSV66_08270 [Trueperaceae bacterium]|nr:MAG: hypothetical protein JSV66_08270 [Trueperaceae bacterium]
MEVLDRSVRTRLNEILAEVGPEVDIDSVRTELEELCDRIGYRGIATHQRTFERILDILGRYCLSVQVARHKLNDDLFRLVAQLEYPSR